VAPFRVGLCARRPPLCLGCLARRPDTSIGEWLHAFRLSRAMTQMELAQAVGVSDATIVYHERPNRTLLTWPFLRKMLWFIGQEFVALEAPKEKPKGKRGQSR
jgi:hypothetical protein